VPALAQSPAADSSPAASEPMPEASPAMTKHHHHHKKASSMEAAPMASPEASPSAS
jgi:hypothetical protein